MGEPKRLRIKYSTPRSAWNKERITSEKKVKFGFGLKNKKELWIAEKKANTARSIARTLLGQDKEERAVRENELLSHLQRTGLLDAKTTLDDVLALKVEDFLDRRLQTQVWKQGLALTVKQARQLIVHGHIALNGNKITTPSYIVKKSDEKSLKHRTNITLITAPPKELGPIEAPAETPAPQPVVAETPAEPSAQPETKTVTPAPEKTEGN